MSKQLIKKMMVCHDKRVVADCVFQYLTHWLSPRSLLFVTERNAQFLPEPQCSYGADIELHQIPDRFWGWAEQFDFNDALIPIATNTCGWDYAQLLQPDSYLLTVDNHSLARTYLLIEGINNKEAQQFNHDSFLDFIYIAVSRWQCLRAEKQAAEEQKNHDIKSAKYLDELKHREAFIEKMKLVQDLSVDLSKPESLDDLYKAAVEAVRDQMGFDRAVFMLLDLKKRTFIGTYGTNEQGETVTEHDTSYDFHQLDEAYIDGLSSQDTSLVVVDNVPLYTAGKVVGEGWNGMLILRDEQEPIGWMSIDNCISRKPITSYQKEMLRSFSLLLSQIYIRKRQEQNMKLLHASMVDLSRCYTVSDVCKSAVSFAITHLGIDRMAVFLTNEQCTLLKGTWGTDLQGQVIDESYFESDRLDQPLVINAMKTPGKVVYADSVPLYHDTDIVGFGWTAMTLLSNSSSKPIAFIAADNLLRRRALTSQNQELLRLFASNLAEVLQRTLAQEKITQLNQNLEGEVQRRTKELEKANKKLELLSNQDALTQLGNRRCFDRLYQTSWQDACEAKQSLAVMMIDVDHFKQFNDFYGHPKGDLVLKAVADILRSYCCGSSNIFCRYGGEEFAALLPNKTCEQLYALAEEIRWKIEKEKIYHQGGLPSSNITVSIGFSQMHPTEKHAASELLERADKALYDAKKQGRNKVKWTKLEAMVTSLS